MRISTSSPGSEVDAGGQVLLTSNSLQVLAADSSRNARGAMGSGSVRYGQLPPDGSRGDAVASWAPLGEFPDRAIALLSPRELTLAYPDAASPAQLRVWGRWEIPQPPSALLGEGAAGVSLPWVSAAVTLERSGLFARPSDARTSVKLSTGCAWVASAGGVTCLDFCTDTATIYQPEAGAEYRGGLHPAQVPDDPYETFTESLAVPSAPYRAVATQERAGASWACVAGGSSVTLLRKDLSLGGVPHYPVHTETFEGFSPWDVAFLPDGSVFVAGLISPSPGAVVGDIGWALRSPVGDGAGTWSGPYSGPSGYAQFTPRIAQGSGAVWVTSGEGNVWRMSDVGGPLGASTVMELWAGPRSRPLLGNQVEPGRRSVYTAAAIAGMAFDGDVPLLLLVLGEDQGGGSVLCAYDRTLSQVLWRRVYPYTMTGLCTSPMSIPGSPPVTLGATRDPAVFYGPDGGA